MLPLSRINHVARLPSLSKSIPIAPSEDTTPYIFEQEVSETANARPVHARLVTIDLSAKSGFICEMVERIKKLLSKLL
jgi:hypothetical protein